MWHCDLLLSVSFSFFAAADGEGRQGTKGAETAP